MLYIIRPLHPEDLDSLLVLLHEHACYEQSSFDPADKKERLANAIFVTKELHCWIVECDDAAEGFVSFTYDYSTWDASHFINMDCLYLRDQIRRRGCGSEILRRLRSLARELKFKNVQWQTPIFNESGIRFYERNGARSFRKARFILDSDDA